MAYLARYERKHISKLPDSVAAPEFHTIDRAAVAEDDSSLNDGAFGLSMPAIPAVPDVDADEQQADGHVSGGADADTTGRGRSRHAHDINREADMLRRIRAADRALDTLDPSCLRSATAARGDTEQSLGEGRSRTTLAGHMSDIQYWALRDSGQLPADSQTYLRIPDHEVDEHGVVRREADVPPPTHGEQTASDGRSYVRLPDQPSTTPVRQARDPLGRSLASGSVSSAQGRVNRGDLASAREDPSRPYIRIPDRPATPPRSVSPPGSSAPRSAGGLPHIAPRTVTAPQYASGAGSFAAGAFFPHGSLGQPPQPYIRLPRPESMPGTPGPAAPWDALYGVTTTDEGAACSRHADGASRRGRSPTRSPGRSPGRSPTNSAGRSSGRASPARSPAEGRRAAGASMDTSAAAFESADDGEPHAAWTPREVLSWFASERAKCMSDRESFGGEKGLSSPAFAVEPAALPQGYSRPSSRAATPRGPEATPRGFAGRSAEQGGASVQVPARGCCPSTLLDSPPWSPAAPPNRQRDRSHSPASPMVPPTSPLHAPRCESPALVTTTGPGCLTLQPADSAGRQAARVQALADEFAGGSGASEGMRDPLPGLMEEWSPGSGLYSSSEYRDLGINQLDLPDWEGDESSESHSPLRVCRDVYLQQLARTSGGSRPRTSGGDTSSGGSRPQTSGGDGEVEPGALCFPWSLAPSRQQTPRNRTRHEHAPSRARTPKGPIGFARNGMEMDPPGVMACASTPEEGLAPREARWLSEAEGEEHNGREDSMDAERTRNRPAEIGRDRPRGQELAANTWCEMSDEDERSLAALGALAPPPTRDGASAVNETSAVNVTSGPAEACSTSFCWLDEGAGAYGGMSACGSTCTASFEEIGGSATASGYGEGFTEPLPEHLLRVSFLEGMDGSAIASGFIEESRSSDTASACFGRTPVHASSSVRSAVRLSASSFAASAAGQHHGTRQLRPGCGRLGYLHYSEPRPPKCGRLPMCTGQPSLSPNCSLGKCATLPACYAGHVLHATPPSLAPRETHIGPALPLMSPMPIRQQITPVDSSAASHAPPNIGRHTPGHSSPSRGHTPSHASLSRAHSPRYALPSRGHTPSHTLGDVSSPSITHSSGRVSAQHALSPRSNPGASPRGGTSPRALPPSLLSPRQTVSLLSPRWSLQRAPRPKGATAPEAVAHGVGGGLSPNASQSYSSTRAIAQQPAASDDLWPAARLHSSCASSPFGWDCNVANVGASSWDVCIADDGALLHTCFTSDANLQPGRTMPSRLATPVAGVRQLTSSSMSRKAQRLAQSAASQRAQSVPARHGISSRFILKTIQT